MCAFPAVYPFSSAVGEPMKAEARGMGLPSPQYSEGARPPATAFAEVTITIGMLDHGFLADRALRQIRYDCHGVDARAACCRASRLAHELGATRVIKARLRMLQIGWAH